MNLIISFPVLDPLLLRIAVADNIITGIDYGAQKQPRNDPDSNHGHSGFAQQIQEQFRRYFGDGSYRFSLPCQLTEGTPFQQQVWQAMQQIPPGQVTSYGALAQTLNSSAQAVGNACRRNPFPIVVPCHRVVSASGLGGYAGDTPARQKGDIDFMSIKRWLLAHEQNSYE